MVMELGGRREERKVSNARLADVSEGTLSLLISRASIGFPNYYEHRLGD